MGVIYVVICYCGLLAGLWSCFKLVCFHLDLLLYGVLVDMV